MNNFFFSKGHILISCLKTTSGIPYKLISARCGDASAEHRSCTSACTSPGRKRETKFSFLNSLFKPACFFLVWLTLFFFSPSYAQKSRSTKAKTSKSSSKRIIYGLASFYADKFNGRRTANGEIFRQSKLTCACNMLPFNTWIKVTSISSGKSVIVRVNDRLHTKMRRLADLSKAAAKRIGSTASGLVRVKVEVIGKKRAR